MGAIKPLEDGGEASMLKQPIFSKKSFLLVVIAGISLGAQSAFAESRPVDETSRVVNCPTGSTSDVDCDRLAVDPKLPYGQQLEKRIENLLARYGNALLNDQLNEKEKVNIAEKIQKLQMMLASAREDKKLTKDERAELTELANNISTNIFSSRHDKKDFQARLNSMRARIASGKKANYLVDSEETALLVKLEKLQSRLNTASEDKLSLEEKKAIEKEMQALGGELQEKLTNTVGTPKPVADRTKDNIDEAQRSLAARLAKCKVSKKINDYEFEQISGEIQSIRKAEQKALADGALSESEKTDLDLSIKKANGNIKLYCEKDTTKPLGVDGNEDVENSNAGNVIEIDMKKQNESVK